MTHDEIYESAYPYSPSDTDGMSSWQALVHVWRQFWGWVLAHPSADRGTEA